MASADELKDQGNKAFAGGKFKEAVDLFTEAISLDSGNHVLFSNRSAAYASMKNYSAALTDAEKCVSIKPEWAKGYSRLGAALHGLNKMREAKDAYEKGLALEPENKALKDGLESVKSKVEDGVNSMASIFAAPDTIERLMKDKTTAAYMADPSFVAKINTIRANPGAAQGLMSDQRILQAMLVLMGMGAKVMTPDQFNAKDFKVDDDEEEIEADRPAAAAAAAAPKPEAPKPAPAKAPEPEPEPMETDDGRPKISKEAKAKAAAEKEAGTAAYKKREFEDALKHYTAAAELDPTDMVFHLNISAVYYEQKEYDKCIEVSVRAAQLGQDNQASFETIAKAYARASKAALAKDELDDSLKHIKKALTNHRLAEYVATERALEKEIAERKRKAYLDPEKAVEHKNKGNDLFKAGDFPAALAEYTESLKRNPDDAKVYGNRAACYIKLAAFPLAIQDCETALKLEPGFIKAYIRKGNGLVGMKKFSEAQSAFNKALEIDANNSEAHEGLAKCRDLMYKGMSTEERRETAMKDPEVQHILSDPVMNTILQQMTQDPKAARDHLKNPEIMRKLQKLIDAGIVSTA